MEKIDCTKIQSPSLRESQFPGGYPHLSSIASRPEPRTSSPSTYQKEDLQIEQMMRNGAKNCPQLTIKHLSNKSKKVHHLEIFQRAKQHETRTRQHVRLGRKRADKFTFFACASVYIEAGYPSPNANNAKLDFDKTLLIGRLREPFLLLLIPYMPYSKCNLNCN